MTAFSSATHPKPRDAASGTSWSATSVRWKDAAERLDDSFDDELRKIPGVPAPAREGIVGEVKQLARDADALRGRVNDGQPSTAEAERMLQRAGKINGFLRANPAPLSNTAFAAILPRLQTVATAYQMVLP
jgi:hypothetical protein